MSLKNFEISDFVLQYITDNKKCLEISYDPSNFSSNIFNLFDEVYSLYFNKNSISNNLHNKTNNCIEFSDLKTFQNYFSENSFDLIIIYNWHRLQANDFLFTILNETKKILKKNGCLLFPISTQTQNNSTFRFKETEKFLKNLNFQISKNWILPSIDNPLYSGCLNDVKPLIWFLKNLNNFIPSFKKKGLKKTIFFKLLKIQHKKFLSFFSKFFNPSFLVCCTLNEINSYNSLILEKTKLDSSIFMNRPYKFMYVLFDDNGNPKQTVSINKTTLDLTKNRNFFQTLDNSAVYRDWVEGRIIDPLNHDEILLAISWITDFQKSNQKDILKSFEIDEEINSLRKTFSSIPDLEKYPITEWIDEYDFFLRNHTLYKTSIHGDLSHKNMILKPNKNNIDVIDWNFFQNSGNPLDDIGHFLFRLTTKSKTKSKLTSFKDKVVGNDQLFNKLRTEIEKVFSNHLNAKFDFLFMIKIHLMKSLYNKILNNEDLSTDLEYISVLSKKSNYNKIQ